MTDPVYPDGYADVPIFFHGAWPPAEPDPYAAPSVDFSFSMHMQNGMYGAFPVSAETMADVINAVQSALEGSVEVDGQTVTWGDANYAVGITGTVDLD